MKILTWNCNGGFRNKFQHLEQFDADILVIQECENTEIAQQKYRSWIPNFIWKGVNINKGIAVFAKSHLSIELLDWKDQGLELFLAIKVNDIQLIAVWTKHANSPTFQYIGQLWKYLKLHQDKLSSRSTIICGDWNSNKKWDVWDRWWNHSDVVKQLEVLDIKSVYHQMCKEEQGEETQPTFYMQRNLAKPFHIDYLFSSIHLFDAEKSMCKVMKQDAWLKYSDHMPILFNLKN